MGQTDEMKTTAGSAKSHLFFNVLIFLTGLLIFLCVPFFFLTPEQSQQVFNNGRGLTIAKEVFFRSGVFFLVIAPLYWIFAFTKFRGLGAFIVLFAFIWVMLSGLLLPLTTANGIDELGVAPTKHVNLVLVIALSGLIALLWMSKHAKIVSVFVGTFLVLSILPPVLAAVSTFKDRSEAALKIPFSSEKNIMLISMDGVPGQLVQEVLANDLATENAFQDFTFFKNVAATAPFTRGSVLGMMFGNHDIVANEPDARVAIPDLFVNNHKKYDFYSGKEYSKYNLKGTSIAAGQFGDAEQRVELQGVYRSTFARLFTRYGVMVFDLLEFFFGIKDNGKFYSTSLGIDTITNIIETGNVKPTIFYAHFVFTHYPTVIDGDCSYKKDDKEWVDNHQNETGARLGAQCAVSKFRQLLEQLKRLGIYDNTLIVFASDHGKPAHFYSQAPHNLMINDNKVLGFNRYQPLLMIKNIGQSQEKIAYSERHVLLDDLALTTCLAFDGSKSCELIDGLDLLDPLATAPDDFSIHMAKDSSSSWRVHTWKSVILPRNIPLEHAMRESDEIELKPHQGR